MKVLFGLIGVVFVAACAGEMEHNLTGSTAMVAPNNSDPSQPQDPDDPPITPPSNPDVPDSGQPDGGDPPGPMPPMEEPVNPGPCGDAGFGEGFSVIGIDGTGVSTRPFAAPTEPGGALITSSGASGLEVVHVGGDGNVLRTHSIEGTRFYGLAASVDAFGVLVLRGSDILALRIVGFDGAEISDQTIIGDVDHNVEGNEWFGNLLRDARLIYTPEDRWVAYYTVQRLWPDGIAHYGDQLRSFHPDGQPDRTIWGWGCSHSMEVRISHNGQSLGPICSSDCFPSKGVHFNHRGGMIYPDEGRSDCAGRYGTTMGGSIPMDDGFWAVFTATDERQSHDAAVARITGAQIGDVIWLTEDDVDARFLNSARFDDHLLVAFSTNNTNRFFLLDGDTGATLEGPIGLELADLSSASDFFTWPSGDIGWAQRSNGSVGLARLRTCR